MCLVSSRSPANACQSGVARRTYPPTEFLQYGAASLARTRDGLRLIGLSSAATALETTKAGSAKASWCSDHGRSARWRFFAAVLSVALMIAVAAIRPATAGNGSVTYTYDALGRVSTASYDTNVIIIYTYDANGNRTAQTINLNTATLTWTATATPCTTNCWGGGLW